MPVHLELACMIVWYDLQEDHFQLYMRHALRLLDGSTSLLSKEQMEWAR